MISAASLAIARALIRDMREAALATLDASGAPFCSLVAVAPDAAGAPLLLLSGLAVHTWNLRRDPRASLLLAEEPTGDGPARARLTLVGAIARADDQEAGRAAFLARHRQAAAYAGLADFAVHRFETESGHLVAGFGRISHIDARDLLRPDEP